MPGPEEEVVPTRGKDTSLVAWAKRVALLLMVLLAVFAVYRNYEELRGDLDQLSPWMVAAAFVPAVLAMLVALQIWRVLMAELGSPLPWGPSARIFYVSQLGKYVPGSVWSVMGQMELGREFKVPRRTSVAVGILVLALSAVGGITLGVALLPFAGADVARRYWWLVLVLPCFYVALHPPVLRWGINTLMRLIRRSPVEALPDWRGLRRALGFQVLTWALMGTHVWLLLIGLGAPVWASLPLAVGGYAMAYSLGMLAFVLPAGAGVREATLVLVLGQVVPHTTALLVALLARAIATVCDLLFAGVELVRWRHRSGSRSVGSRP